MSAQPLSDLSEHITTFGPFFFDAQKHLLYRLEPPPRAKAIVSDQMLHTMRWLARNKNGVALMQEFCIEYYGECTTKTRMRVARNVLGIRHLLDQIIPNAGYDYIINHFGVGYSLLDVPVPPRMIPVRIVLPAEV